MNYERISIRSAVIALSILACTVCCADDFSVDLKRLVEMDETKPLPEYELERVVLQEKPDADMPSKNCDVFIKFAKFGSLRLDKSGHDGPSSGKTWRKGMMFDFGLASLEAVKVAWIKNSPDLLLVAWIIEPDGRGTARSYRHGFTIIQLRDQRAKALLRGESSVTAKIRGGVQDGVLDSSHFSFDAKRGVLKESFSRHYEEWYRESDPSRPLTRLRRQEGGGTVFVASIHETIELEYKFVSDNLQASKGSLIYHTQEHDRLHEISGFYLGPYAPANPLIEANPQLAAKYKDDPERWTDLEPETQVTVPVPDKWLIKRFARTTAERKE